MMNTQESKSTAGSVSGPAKVLASGQVVMLGTGGGDLQVLAGRVWLTSPNDLDDHLLAPGESFRVEGSGPTLVEAWGSGQSALIAWRPKPLMLRLRDAWLGTCERCWDLMHPAGRLGMGTTAALAALVAAALLFGPVSQARIRALARPASAAALLHNAGGVAVDAIKTRESLADGSDIRDRSSRPAQEAGRRTPGAA